MISFLKHAVAFLALSSALGGCVTQRTLLMATPVASMNQANSKAEKALKEGKPVKETFCSGDKAVSTSANNVGVIDELLTRAHNSSKAAYITEVQIFSVNQNCWELEGKGAN